MVNKAVRTALSDFFLHNEAVPQEEFPVVFEEKEILKDSSSGNEPPHFT